MAAPILNSISPSSGPPGSTVSVTGSGFDPAAQLACPVLVATTVVDATALSGEIPADLAGADGTSVMVSVFVRNPDGQTSAPGIFTVVFPVRSLQTWTTLEAVAGEVAGFKRGMKISDETILGWMKSTAQDIAGAMLRRGLSTDPAAWQQPGAGGGPAPTAVLEQINRMGAAASLAATIAGLQNAGWELAKHLQRKFDDGVRALRNGDYDKLFKPSAATVESGPLLSAGDMTNDDGSSSAAFTKGRVF